MRADHDRDDQADRDAAEAETTNPAPICHTLTVPAIAAIEVRSVTIAVASLTRLSPSRIVTTRRGRPDAARDRCRGDGIRRRDDRTERERRRPAARRAATRRARPTPTVVNSTSPTRQQGDRARCWPGSRSATCGSRRRTAAAAAGRPGRSRASARSSGTNGRYEPTMPTTISTRGADTPSRPASALTATTMASRVTSVRAVSTRPFSQAATAGGRLLAHVVR